MREGQKLFESGKFFVGVNWWASHAGTNMWRDWDERVVEEDIIRLKNIGVDVMRVFPLWTDFQPLRVHSRDSNIPREVRMGEEPLPHTEEGRAGVDPVMVERFARLCALAGKHGVKLIVGLVTGWMSGRMHAPEAFADRDLLRDPFVIKWQIKFVKYMVRRFKGESAIAAWDLGNECNCLNNGVSQYEAYVWASAITNAIKSEDSSRPVVSGMHGTFPGDDDTFRAQDLGEILDVLCTHPYPIFTPHCDTDPLGEMKTVLHSTAETLLYGNTGGVPAFVEEIGTLGPMISSEEIAADHIRACLISAFAHNLRGFVWWCANEQIDLTHTPYDWNAVERELGLFRVDGSNKPVAESMSEMSRFVDNFEYKELPERVVDARVIITHGQDSWAVAYGSFILAKQAGLDVAFSYVDDEIPESDAYLLPSLVGDKSVSKHVMDELLSRVRRGARLYISVEDALLSPFREITGVKVLTRSRRVEADYLTIDGKDLRLDSSFKLELELDVAEALFSDKEGAPVLTRYKLGDGLVYFLSSPIEHRMGALAGLASGKYAKPYYKLYEAMNLKSPAKLASSSDPTVCVTEHILDDSSRLIIVINYTRCDKNVNISLKNSYKIAKIFDIHGRTEVKNTDGGFNVDIAADNGFIALVSK